MQDLSPPMPQAPRPAPARVVIIDDDPDFREFVHIVLETHGYEVHEADDATAGIALMRERLARPGPARCDDVVRAGRGGRDSRNPLRSTPAIHPSHLDFRRAQRGRGSLPSARRAQHGQPLSVETNQPGRVAGRSRQHCGPVITTPGPLSERGVPHERRGRSNQTRRLRNCRPGQAVHAAGRALHRAGAAGLPDARKPSSGSRSGWGCARATCTARRASTPSSAPSRSAGT